MMVNEDGSVLIRKLSIPLSKEQPIKLLVTYYPHGDTYTEILNSKTECVTPETVADFIANDAYDFSTQSLLDIIRQALERVKDKS